MILYAVTIFVGSFLLFLVQPLLGKFILPWFGGAPGVWTTAMLFFQTMLLGGYLYAHAVVRRLPIRGQAVVHAGLLLASLALLPITPDRSWQPRGDEAPVGLILKLLFVQVGLPYLLLAGTNPLMQAWFHSRWPAATPYRLYALSNLGSLLALLAFPVVVEPSFTSTRQAEGWSYAYLAFAALAVTCAVLTWRRRAPNVNGAATPVPDAAGAKRPTFGDVLMWLGLSSCGAVLYLATTNYVCLDVAVIPLLWITPLALYLLTFVLVFERSGWYSRKLTMLLLTALFGAALVRTSPSIWEVIAFYFALLFVMCLMVHGELARAKPAPAHLTAFYLTCAAGGALGGAFVTLLCPLIFVKWSELALALLMAFALTLTAMLRGDGWRLAGRLPSWVGKTAIGALLLAIVGVTIYVDRRGRPVAAARNFFGIVKVTENREADPGQDHFDLISGAICHGSQFHAAGKKRLGTTYYGPESGAGLAMRHFERPGGRRVAAVGLGVGTLATYGRTGDRITFYEINPEVIRLARRYFSYLKESEASAVDVVVGDARLSLQREGDESVDVLVVDAFSGDAIPVHLLTQEAFDIYLRLLKKDGVLVLHISNKHVDLLPVLARAAGHYGLDMVRIKSGQDAAAGVREADYVILTRNRAFLARKEIAERAKPVKADVGTRTLWTDNRNNVMEVLR